MNKSLGQGGPESLTIPKHISFLPNQLAHFTVNSYNTQYCTGPCFQVVLSKYSPVNDSLNAQELNFPYQPIPNSSLIFEFQKPFAIVIP